MESFIMNNSHCTYRRNDIDVSFSTNSLCKLIVFFLAVIVCCETIYIMRQFNTITPFYNNNHKTNSTLHTFIPIKTSININKSSTDARLLNFTQDCRSICRNKYSYSTVGPPSRTFNALDPVSELVCPSMFRDLADFVWTFPFNHFGEANPKLFGSIQEIANCLLPGSIIFSQTGPGVGGFASDMMPHIHVPFIFITGQSDYNPSGDSILNNPNLIAWFAQNVNFFHKKLIPIPLGVNCFEHGPETIQALRQQQTSSLSPPNCSSALWKFDPYCPLYETSLSELLHIYSDRLDFVPKHLQPLATVNFGLASAESRKPLFESLCGQSVKERNSKWLNCPKEAFKGQQNSIKNNPHLVNLYLEHSKYQFWFSPEGNGIDCHRTWESLYMGSIPIVLNSTLVHAIYHDMPVLIVEDFSQVTELFLLQQLHTKFNSLNKFNRHKLVRAYWYKLIVEMKRNATNMPIQSIENFRELDREHTKCYD